MPESPIPIVPDPWPEPEVHPWLDDEPDRVVRGVILGVVVGLVVLGAVFLAFAVAVGW